ncbi:MAG: hypothetical protein WBF23_09825, partial [Methyloceanibacter sp.]
MLGRVFVVHRVVTSSLALTLLVAWTVGAVMGAAEPRVSVVPKGIQSALPAVVAQAKLSMLRPETKPTPAQNAPGLILVTPVAKPEPLPLSGQNIASMMLMASPSPIAAASHQAGAPEPAAVAPRAVKP